MHQGNIFQNVREQNGRSIEDTSRNLGIQASVLREIENGTRLPEHEHIFKLAHLSGLDETSLLLQILNSILIDSAETVSIHPSRRRQLESEYERLMAGQMSVHFYHPQESVKQVVETMYLLNHSDTLRKTERILPDARTYLHFFLTEGKEGAVVVTQRTTYHELPFDQNLKRFTVRFTPYGLSLITGIPQYILSDKNMDAEYLFGKSVNDLLFRLMEMKKPEDMFSNVSRFFESKLKNVLPNALHIDVIDYSLQHISASVNDLAYKTGFSYKHLKNLISRYVGINPKQYQQIVKFQNAIKSIGATMSDTFTDITYQNGYYDQAHFTRNFSHFSGFTPGNYLKTGNLCPRLMLL